MMAAAAGDLVARWVLDEAQPCMRFYDDEMFGPVLGVVRVDSYDDAVALVNAGPYGNEWKVFGRALGVIASGPLARSFDNRAESQRLFASGGDRPAPIW